jgi:hypothetical protein
MSAFGGEADIIVSLSAITLRQCMSARWRIVQIAFDLRPAIGGLSLIAFGKPDFHITGRGAGQRRDRQLRRSPLANAMSG